MLKNITHLFLLAVCLAASDATAGPVSSLQALIEQTPEGGVVRLQPGKYIGPVVVEKAVVLDGKGQVTIDGQGKGSVMLIKADGVVVKNMIITNSGDSHDQLDAGILVRSSRNRILNNRIENTLFGIDIQEGHENEVIGNEISSKNISLGLRGDGVRIWAGHRNVFRQNRIHDSRDMVIWYSNDNLIEHNEGWNNRYSMHFMFTGGNLVRRNYYHHNTVGIFLMYSRDIVVRENVVKYSLGGTGVGIGLKEVDNMTIVNNQVVYCTAGFFFDLSPFQPETYNFIKANIIAYNVIGADFNSTLSRNILKGNAFIDNLETVKVRGQGVASQNLWEGNSYSDYEGFDRDKDGYGDSVYNHDIYLDTLWMNNDWMLLFSGSPVVSVLNLLAKLAPISEPKRLMTDPKPVFSPRASVLFSEANLKYDPPVINLEKDDDKDGARPARFASVGGDKDEEEEENEEMKKRENYNRYFLHQ